MQDIGHRIAIIGPMCSGKSTLAVTLGRKLNVPVHFLDTLAWVQGQTNVERPDADFINDVAALVKAPAWITEGVYSRSLDIQARAADTVIVLDFPRWLCVWRYARRCWREAYSAEGQIGRSAGSANPFSFSTVKWMLYRFPHKNMPKIEKAIAAGQPKRLLRFRSQRALDKFLAS